MAKSPKKPAKTAQEVALERRQNIALNKEIERTEEKSRLFTRKSLGTVSLLSRAPGQAPPAAKTPNNSRVKAPPSRRAFARIRRNSANGELRRIKNG